MPFTETLCKPFAKCWTGARRLFRRKGVEDDAEANAESEGAKKGNSSFVTIFSVWNTALGTSLLAVPWAIEAAGLLLGVCLTLGMAGMCLYSALRILQIYKIHGDPDVGDVPELCRILVGRWLEWFARLISTSVLLGAVLVYWILMTNFLFSSVRVSVEKSWGILDTSKGPCVVSEAQQDYPTVFDSDANPTSPSERDFAMAWNLHYTVPFYLIVVAAPLMFLGRRFFSRFSALGTVSVFYMLLFILVKSISFGVHVDIHNEGSVDYVPIAKWTFPVTAALLALAMFIHNLIVSIMRNNRHQEKNARDLSIAYMLITFSYAFIGLTFYICFPKKKTCIEDNLLNNFPLDDPMTIVARCFLFFQLLSVFPLLSSLMRDQFFLGTRGVANPGIIWTLTFNLVEVALCVLTAVFFPRIGTVIRYFGAVSGFVYIFTLPVVLYFSSLKQRQELKVWKVIAHVWIPVLGLAILIAQFFIS